MEKLTLKALRAQKNMTQKDVADAIGVSLSTYHFYERDPMRLPLPKLVALANLHGVSISDIFLPSDLTDGIVNATNEEES